MSYRSIESNYQINSTAQFKMLSEDQCRKIIFSAMEVLERTGVLVEHIESLNLLKDAGCWVDGTRVRIPSYVVQNAINTAPKRIVLCDRDGKRKLFLEGNNSYFGNTATSPKIIDLETGERRDFLKQDVADTAKICDALENFDIVLGGGLVTDQHPSLADVHEAHAMLTHTRKPLLTWGNSVGALREIIDMCSVIAGGFENFQRNPFIAFFSESAPPLKHPGGVLEKLLFLAEKRIPQIYNPGVMMGGTTPVTIAGAIVCTLADNFVGLILSQLKSPGAPFIAGTGICSSDMRTMQNLFGGPEQGITFAASRDVFKYLGLPSESYGGGSDSKILDMQFAIECSINSFVAALSGANLILYLGYLEMAMTTSLEGLVINDEIISYARRIVDGVRIDTDTLAVDVIDEVGPGGHFFYTDHTFRNFKKELWVPSLCDRDIHHNWEQGGKKTFEQRANQKAREILRDHQVAPLSKQTLSSLDKILGRAELRISKE